MSDYSKSGYVRDLKSTTTIYGVDTAIVIVVLASALFWFSVATAIWLFW